MCFGARRPNSFLSSKNGVMERLQSQYCCGFLFQGSSNSSLSFLTLRSILAKPRALDARSLASWNSSLSDRLVSITDRLKGSKGLKLKNLYQAKKRETQIYHPPYRISSDAVLSSALSQNSLPLFLRPTSRNPPVDLSSIPAISLNRVIKSPVGYNHRLLRYQFELHAND